MKKNIIVLALLALVVTSCGPSIYYQVFSMKKTTEPQSPIKVSYDFWSNKGQCAATITNTTDQNVNIDLGMSFFILNGRAVEYLRNTSVSHTESSTAAASYKNLATASGSATSVTTHQSRILIIPPYSSRSIAGYELVPGPYNNGDAFKYPSKKSMPAIDFTGDVSPVSLRSIIHYQIDSISGTCEDQFYLNRIVSMEKSSFIVYIPDSSKGVGAFFETYPFKSAEKFYIRYTSKY